MVSLGRPVWSGQIRLSLVALPVKLYSATESRLEALVPPGPRALGQAHPLREGGAGRRPGEERRDRQGLRDREGPLRPARPGGDRRHQDRGEEDARTGAVRRSVRDRSDLLRPALLRRARGRARRGRLPRACAMRCGARQGRARADRDARARVYRRAQALRPRADAGDAAFRGRAAQEPTLTSRRSRTTRADEERSFRSPKSSSSARQRPSTPSVFQDRYTRRCSSSSKDRPRVARRP